MGEVYRGRDTELARDVAIKVLPASVASDADRITRLEQEAKTLAALNHANIAQIYGIERSDDATALVMELVEGPTLADRIEQGPVPAEEALGIAMQITEALEAAHGRQIVHRDLKPANIKLTPDGIVKVLDFGIAKIPEPTSAADGGRTPTPLTPAHTEAGVLLGTAAYMAPEQAKGRPIDQRADVWAFGCVLYEMLTGQPAFGGEDVTTTLARVLEREPDMRALPGSVSAAVRRAIALCLEKDPRQRIRHIGDVRLALEGRFAPDARAEGGARGSALRRPALPAAVAVLVTAAIAGLVGMSLRPVPPPEPASRFDWETPADQDIGDTQSAVLALSPDGRRIVYGSVDGLYVRDMGELEARRIPGTEGQFARAPFFSPDGRSVGYLFRSELRRVPIDGGAALTIGDELERLQGASWSDDDTILFGSTQGIHSVPAAGGEPSLVIPAEDGEFLWGPQRLPDGDSVLFSSTARGADWDTGRILVQSISSGERTVLVEGGNDARYAAPGALLYARGDELFAVGFDPGSLTVSGERELLAQGVRRAQFRTTPTANYGAAAGTLIYARGRIFADAVATSVWVDRDGREEPLELGPCACFNPVLSPDGSRVAVQILSSDRTASNIYVGPTEQSTPTRLTFAAGLQDGPLWTPNAAQLAYRWPRGGGIFLRRTDGTGTPEQLLESTRGAAPFAWTESGELIFVEQDGDRRVIGLLGSEGEREPVTLLASRSDLWRPALSPDERWLAYQSNETGRWEIYVRPFPDVESGLWQVSEGGGEEPRWSGDGGTLFFRGSARMMAVPIEAAAVFDYGEPEPILDITPYVFPDGPPRSYDVSRDGQRFLFLKLPADETAASVFNTLELVIVRNWRSALDGRALSD